MANDTKNNYKKMEQYSDAVAKLEEKHSTGFVDDTELSKMEAIVEDARKKKNDAKKKLDKMMETISASPSLTPEQRVQKEIQYKYERRNITDNTARSENKETEIDISKEKKKPKYFTDNLTKLDRSKRKLVGQIMGIVSRIAPADIAAKIQATIEQEFR